MIRWYVEMQLGCEYLGALGLHSAAQQAFGDSLWVVGNGRRSEPACMPSTSFCCGTVVPRKRVQTLAASAFSTSLVPMPAEHILCLEENGLLPACVVCMHSDLLGRLLLLCRPGLPEPERVLPRLQGDRGSGRKRICELHKLRSHPAIFRSLYLAWLSHGATKVGAPCHQVRSSREAILRPWHGAPG